MKKFLTLFIVLCLILSACGRKDPQLQPTPQPTPVSVVKNDYGSIVEMEKEADKGLVQLNGSDLDRLNRWISNINPDVMLTAKKQKQLEQNGISVAVEKIEKIDNDNVNLSVVITAENKKDINITIPRQIMYRKDTRNNDTRLLWGNISTGNNSIVITTNNNLLVYSLDTFEKQEISFDFLSMMDSRYYLLDTVAYADGFITAYYSEDGDGVLTFDNSGRLVKNNLISTLSRETKDWRRDYLFGKKDTNGQYNLPVIIPEKIDIALRKDKPEMLAVFRQTDNGTSYRANVMAQYKNITIGANGIPVYEDNGRYIYIMEHQILNDNGYGPVNWYVLFEDTDGTVINRSVSSGSGIMDFFRPDEAEYSISEDMATAVIHHKKSGVKIVFDLKGANDIFYTNQYEFTQEDLTDTTKDGKYSLYRGAYGGGGDVRFWQVVLMENATGRTKYIDTIGGMYGGNNDAGFFSNNDVYVINTDGMKIFDTDMDNKNYVFRLGDNFAFGANPTKDLRYRYLTAARRDPVDGTFLAVYFDEPHYAEGENEYLGNNANSYFLKSTYKVGYFDTTGRLLKEYDTGAHRVTTGFGHAYVNMYLKDGHIVCMETSGPKSPCLTKGELDLQTGKYTRFETEYTE